MTDPKKTKKSRGATAFPAERRDRMIGLNVTAAEMAALDRVADRYGVSRATVARKALLDFLAAVDFLAADEPQQTEG
jgi:hypothetical protein